MGEWVVKCLRPVFQSPWRTSGVPTATRSLRRRQWRGSWNGWGARGSAASNGVFFCYWNGDSLRSQTCTATIRLQLKDDELQKTQIGMRIPALLIVFTTSLIILICFVELNAYFKLFLPIWQAAVGGLRIICCWYCRSQSAGTQLIVGSELVQ